MSDRRPGGTSGPAVRGGVSNGRMIIPQKRMSRIVSCMPKNGKRAVEIRRGKLADARNGVTMDTVESGRERLDGPRPFDVRRLRAHVELALLDAVAGIGVAFGEVPRELTKRPAAGVRPEVVLVGRERKQAVSACWRLPGSTWRRTSRARSLTCDLLVGDASSYRVGYCWLTVRRHGNATPANVNGARITKRAPPGSPRAAHPPVRSARRERISRRRQAAPRPRSSYPSHQPRRWRSISARRPGRARSAERRPPERRRV